MGDKSGNVMALPFGERARIDPLRVLRLRRDLGEAGAAQVMQRAVDGLAADLARMEAIEVPMDAAGVAEFCRAGRRLGRVAGQVGLTRIARVADDAVRLAPGQDPVAAAATWARLRRLCGLAIGPAGVGEGPADAAPRPEEGTPAR